MLPVSQFSDPRRLRAAPQHAAATVNSLSPPCSLCMLHCTTANSSTRRAKRRRLVGYFVALLCFLLFIIGSRVVSVQKRRRARVQIAVATLLGNSLRQIIHTHRASVHQAAKLVAALLRGAVGNCRPGGKQWQPTTGFMTHVTCRLTAKNRDQLRNPTLGNRIWATFTFLNSHSSTNQCTRKCIHQVMTAHIPKQLT